MIKFINLKKLILNINHDIKTKEQNKLSKKKKNMTAFYDLLFNQNNLAEALINI